MAYPVRGNDVVVELLVDGDYYPVLCGLDCSFTREVEFISIRTADSSVFDEVMPRRENWSVTVNGVTKIENDTVLTFFYLLMTSVRRTIHTIRVTFTDEAGGSKQIDGSVYIGSESITGPFADYANASIEFRGTGAFTVSTTTEPVTPEYNIYSDYWIPTNGNSYSSGASTGYTDGTQYTLAATDIILEVWVESVPFYATTGTPTNGSPEYKFDTGTLRLNFPAAFVFDGSQRVMVLFKRPV